MGIPSSGPSAWFAFQRRRQGLFGAKAEQGVDGAIDGFGVRDDVAHDLDRRKVSRCISVGQFGEAHSDQFLSRHTSSVEFHQIG